MKSTGINGWRTAHNPPTEAVLDAADRLGMLVWDENHKVDRYSEVCFILITPSLSSTCFKLGCGACAMF